MNLKILSIINKSFKEKKKITYIPYNNLSLIFIKLLYKEGYLSNYKIWYNKILIEFSVKEGFLACNGIKIYKKNKNSSYMSFLMLNKMIKKKNKRYIISTSYGICTNIDVLKYGIGGLVIGEFI